jgi:predicted N-acetyltransferase YhbS
MPLTVRPYRPSGDYDVVARFLVDVYDPGGGLANWLRPRWEYMHSHVDVDDLDLTSIGIAERDGAVAGIVHPEDNPAFNFFQLRRDADAAVREALVDWAEAHLGGPSLTLQKDVLGYYVDDGDDAMATLLDARGYTASSEWGESHARIPLEVPPPPARLPAGYRLASLADDNDLRRVNRVLWRGFGHDGEPPDDYIPNRARAQATPNYRKDLNVVVVAPGGDFAAYAGIWVEEVNRVAYVEPVATDPDHRRRGLATAAVGETLRRARRRGATVAWVGSDQPFYLSMGFEVAAHATLWWKER